MKIQSGKWKVESGKMAEGNSPFRLSHFPFRNAMTLIELMVVIVILVALVAGVLPLVSPNNDARKIAEASRGLQTYLMQAQAEAARLGRPVGVGFRESAKGSGVALEAFQLAVPAPYAGLDPNARVQIINPAENDHETYGFVQGARTRQEGGTWFAAAHNGKPLYRLQFVSLPNYTPEPIPDGILKIGDTINLEGNEFLVADTVAQVDLLRRVNSSGYLFRPEGLTTVQCIWVNDFGQQPPAFAPKPVDDGPPVRGNARTYLVQRQPASDGKFGGSSEPPYQFPAGVAIDFQGSGLERGGEPETFSDERETTSNDEYEAPDNGKLRQIGIMFSPNGGIESVWVDGYKYVDSQRIFLLLGRVENQNPPATEYVFSNRQGGTATDEELRESREKVNWLNLDSRWMMITSNNGRFNVAKNANFDPRNEDHISQADPKELAQMTKIKQIEAAHGLGHSHEEPQQGGVTP